MDLQLVKIRQRIRALSGRKWKIGRIQQVMKEVEPVTVVDLLVKCGFGLRHINDGVFRDVFEIVNSDFVIKIPKDGESLCHAHDEAMGWKKVERSKNPAATEARRYLPRPFLYYEPSGFIIMPQYRTTANRRYDRKMDHISDIFRQVICKGKEYDIDLGACKYDNYGFDKHGNIFILDLGCFSKDWWGSAGWSNQTGT